MAPTGDAQPATAPTTAPTEKAVEKKANMAQTDKNTFQQRRLAYKNKTNASSRQQTAGTSTKEPDSKDGAQNWHATSMTVQTQDKPMSMQRQQENKWPNMSVKHTTTAPMSR
jgi:hypothetical protein